MRYHENKKRVIAAITETDEPLMQIEIFKKTSVSEIFLLKILEELEAEGKIKSRVCQLARHPYHIVRMWYRAGSNSQFPVYENKNRDDVLAAITREPQTHRQIREKTGIRNVHNYLTMLERLKLVVCKRTYKQPHVWFLQEESNDKA